MLSTKLKEAAGNSADATLYVDDVFSTYLWDNVDGTSNPVVNGIDLSTNGGFVWMKKRTSSFDNHILYDTARGTTSALSSNTTNSQTAGYGNITYNTTGFTKGAGGGTGSFVGWTFRKAAKFFDVVTYTGTGSARTIAHSLGVAPGMIIVKRTDTAGNWQVYSNGLTSAAYSIQLNLTAAQASAPTVWNSTAPTSSVFSVGTDASVNASGGTYVAYLFAHDTSSTGIIQCGSYVGNGSATGPTVSLGWEPQYLMIKESTAANSWTIFDQMRYLNNDGSGYLTANSTAVENGTSGLIGVLATGFRMLQSGTLLNQSGQTYIYMAIRRPNKPPTSGTQVFSPLAATASSGTVRTTGFPIDLQIFADRTAGAITPSIVDDRLRGVSTTTTASGVNLYTSNTGAESTTALTLGFNNTGFVDPAYYSGYPFVWWNFKRAPGFFDEICYTGTGSATTQAHNLGVVPEFIIVKTRGVPASWRCYLASLGNTTVINLNITDAAWSIGTALWNATTPTSTVFSLGTNADVNEASYTYVAYLFATLAGISKVGSFTGNGTGQSIACGFSAGARFVLIKRTDSTGGWYTFDSARGLTSGSSPYLLLNSNAAEVTGNNGVYASTGGFTLGSTASATTNINGASYIYLSVA